MSQPFVPRNKQDVLAGFPGLPKAILVLLTENVEHLMQRDDGLSSAGGCLEVHVACTFVHLAQLLQLDLLVRSQRMEA